MAVEDGSSQPPWVRTFFGPTQGWRNVPESEILGGSFLDFGDTPDSYAGQALRHLRVNAAATGIEFEPVAVALEQPWVFATDFGVVANNIADDTAALNACFASVAEQSATVILPPGWCKTTGRVTVGTTNINGGQSHINILGMGSPATSGIRYIGPTNEQILTVSRMTNFSFHNFGVWNNAGSLGTTVGIALGGRTNPADFGNLTNNFQFYGINVYSCNTGIAAGINFGAASEGTFHHCGFSGHNTVFVANDFNSLNFQFIQLAMGENVRGLDTGVSSGFNVYGGSASNHSETVFFIGGNANCRIIGFRSETQNRFVLAPVNGGACFIDQCNVVNPQGTPIDVGGHFNRLTISNTVLAGAIHLSTVPGELDIVDNELQVWDTIRKMPIIYDVQSGTPCRAYFRNNRDIGVFPPRTILDFQGRIGGHDDGVVHPFLDSCISVIPIDRITHVNQFGTDYLALSHVRSLSEAPIVGAAAGVAPNPGKNLRVRGTLAAGTLAFTFVRTLTVNCFAFQPNVIITAGVNFTTADIGKKIFIQDGADTYAGVPTQGPHWYGYIIGIVSPTQANVYPGQPVGSDTPGGRYPQGFGKSASIGEYEPDANYLVTGIVGSVPESFGVSSVATTGFTITSSNGASTATVTAMIVR